MTGLPKKRRLLAHEDFVRTQRKGIRVSSGLLVLIARAHMNRGRVGLTVSKKVGKSHDRNLLKRRLRHLAREYFSQWQHWDLVVITLSGSAELPFLTLKQQFLRAISLLEKKIHIRK